MARIFITGSADGLGQLAANVLIAQGHKVVLHARNATRGSEALDKVPGAETVVTADLTSIDETIQLSEKVNALGSLMRYTQCRCLSCITKRTFRC
jgi:NAD(P)-dependent dehydrogenase (short-subunit alcohol dehydrogenase family)